MAVTSYATGVNPTGPGLTDGSITITLQDPYDPGKTYYYSIDYGDNFTVSGAYKTFTGLGAGSYFCLIRVDGEFSVPQEIVLLDGSEPVDPDAKVYKDFYHAEFCDKNGDNINVDIQRFLRSGDPDPDVTNIILAGEEPVTISYKDGGEYKLIPVIGSECIIRINSDANFQLSSMYTTSETEWRIKISGAWNWMGFVIPDECSEPFANPPYAVEIQATDRTGTLKDKLFQYDDLSNVIGTFTDLEMIQMCLAKTSLQLPIVIGVSTIETGMNPLGYGGCPLTKTAISGLAFINKEKIPIDTYEVLRSIVQRWSCRLFQWDAKWHLVNVLELSNGTVKAWTFDYDMTYLGSEDNIVIPLTVGGSDRTVQPVGDVSFAKGMKSSTVLYKYGYLSNEFYNGNFDIWTTRPSGLPDAWTAVGINATTGIRQFEGVDTTDFYVNILATTTGGANPANGYLTNDTTALIKSGEETTVSFNFLAFPDATVVPATVTLRVILHDVTNDRYFTRFGWQAAPGGGAFITYNINYSNFDLKAQITAQINTLTPQEGDYDLSIAIMALKRGSSTYHGISVNNVTISQSTNEVQVKPGVYRQHKQKTRLDINFTREDIKILHSDEPLETLRTSGIIISGLLGAAESKEWTREGFTEAEPLQYIIANTELILHQQAYRVLDMDFKNAYRESIGPLTLLTVDLIPAIGTINTGDFVWQSGKFKLKEGNHKLKFAESMTNQMSLLVPGGETIELYDEKN